MKIPDTHTMALTIGVLECSNGYHLRVEFARENMEDFLGPHRDTFAEAEQDAFDAVEIWKKTAGEESLIIPAYTVN